MTTFQDIFKKSFLEGYAASGLTTKSIIFSLLLASAFALYIFIVYRSFTRKTFYSKSFNISLAALTVITAAVILTIQSSIVVSLGRCAVHCPVPDGGERPHGFGFSVLGNFHWYYLRRRAGRNCNI